jgi:hypothetical protein
VADLLREGWRAKNVLYHNRAEEKWLDQFKKHQR